MPFFFLLAFPIIYLIILFQPGLIKLFLQVELKHPKPHLNLEVLLVQKQKFVLLMVNSTLPKKKPFGPPEDLFWL